MKKILWVGLAALLSSCHEDITEGNGIPGVDLVVMNAEIYQQYITRAADGGFGDGDQIGVFVVNRENGEPQVLQTRGNHADNVCFTYSARDGKWTGSYQLFWKDKNTHADAYGYYPFDAELSSVDAYPFTIQSKQNATIKGKTITGYEASDFLWAKAEDVAAGTPIHLKHHHIMAGVEVTLVEGDNFTGSEWANLEKAVLVKNTCTATIINIGTGEVTVSDGNVSSITPQQRGTVWRAVVAPQTVSADKVLLSITVNGVGYDFQRSTDMIYYPGKLHKFTLVVNKKQADGDYEFNLISEAITAWENDPTSHQGETKEYIIVNMTRNQYLGDVLKEMKLDPEKIINLKLVGEMSAKDNWYWKIIEDGVYIPTEDIIKQTNFSFIRHQLTNLEALNMKELRLKDAGDKLELLYYDWDGYGYDDVIPFRAFWGMHSLTSFVYPDRLKSIGNEAFQGCNLKGSCILPEGLEYVGDKAYSRDDVMENAGGSEQLETRCHMSGDLYIPSSCKYIGKYAFYKQDFSCELILPERMEYLGECAFGGCRFMTGYLHIPKGLTDILPAWQGMTGLKGWAEIPDGVTKVYGIGCPISSLHIPEGVTELSVFGYSYNKDIRSELKEIYLPSTLRTLGEFYCFASTGITHIKLPDGIEIIPSRCFQGCEDLQDTLYLPKSLYAIEQEAFSGCKQLTAVVIPTNVIYIGDGAFGDCFSLDYVQCMGMEPPQLSETAFWGVEKNNFTLVVPEGAVDAYRNAPGWSEFKRISAYRNFVCRPMQEKLLNKGHQYEVILNADGNWTVTHLPSWAHISATSGNKKTALIVTVDDLNHGGGNRKDSIVFTLTGQIDEEGKPVTCYYKLSQYDYQYDEDSELSLQKATKGNGKINIFLCGDGYDAQDIAEGKYLDDMRQEAEYFFDIEPYKTYKDYFNVYMGFAMSRESGINSINKWRETKFESKMGNGCSDNLRLEVNFDKAMLYALEVSPQLAPDGVSAPLVIFALNTERYEGLTAMWSDGAAVAACTMSIYSYPYDARGIVQHEAGGHGFGKLADEYIYHAEYIQRCGCSCCEHVPELLDMKNKNWARNLSLDGKYGSIEWRQLIFDSHYSDICNIYEGGFFHQRGVYRSEVNSCMKNNIPYYSTVSRMAIVERIKQYAGEAFSYDDFVAHDSRTWGNKYITRSTEVAEHTGRGPHLKAPVLKKGSVMDLLKKNRKK